MILNLRLYFLRSGLDCNRKAFHRISVYIVYVLSPDGCMNITQPAFTWKLRVNYEMKIN